MNELDVPALPPLVTVMVSLALLFVIVTVPDQVPPEKLLVVLGLMVPVKSDSEALPVKFVTRLLLLSSARMLMVNGVPATWLAIEVITK